MFWSRLRQAIYAALTIIGFVWTNYYLVQFIIATTGDFSLANLGQFDMAVFSQQAFANAASSFVGIDVLMGLLASITLIVAEGRRLQMKVWGLYIVLMFAISFAVGLCLFLFMRERTLAQQQAAA
ncbi:hypothetical protein XM38_022040 [Halomicronema hongdechloris C2206]|uniref:DUF2834 domain-containing protein n=1 Tax=Halomicronema hongdechloris C2206 TaxID=1641165 RepID=A0A1Z3HLQ7_9CYAN|nr:DUF2834 domain-containing protein [Halomicronema hongdechloris]ASC71252.1 hypothetical protein XM38_022040 [Halomicronema hongdechloris C2206]